MSAPTLPPAPSPLVGLAGLLAGLGGDVPWPEVQGGRAERRTCIDAGAGVVVAVRAPGPRALDLQVRTATAGEVEEWAGIRTEPGVAPVRSRRRIWTGREGGPPVPGDPSAALRGRGRVWGVEYDAGGAPLSVAWQLHRGADPSEALSHLGLGAAWRAAAAEFDALHGFAASATSGPWSISRRLAGAPDEPPVVRVGTSRWAWSLDDAAKGARLADRIGHHGGDRAFASALFDLLTRDPGGASRVGRAVEVDIVGDQVVALSAYLVVPASTGTPSPTEGSRP